MKRMCLVGAAAFAAVVGLSLDASATTRWQGKKPTGDWAVASNWTEGVPAADGVAAFYRPSGTNFIVNVTPPSDFTGTILVSNNIAGASGDSYLNKRFSMMLSLGGAKNAQWKVKGNGHLVATEGIVDRIDPSFVGIIEVRKGSSFVASADLNEKVAFIGAGELTLANAAQVEQIRGFAGKVCLADGDEVVCTDAGLLAGHVISIPDGGTVSLDPESTAYGSVRTFDFEQDADQWSFNGTSWRYGTLKSGPYSPEPPYLTADNVLMLTDDPAQVHTVWYTNRMFRVTDDIGCSFRWTPNLPEPSRVTQEGRHQVQSGNFSVLFQAKSPTNVRLPNAEKTTAFNRSSQATEEWGFTMYTYQDGNASLYWITSGAKGEWTDALYANTTDGLTLAKPIDFTVFVNKGLMTVTLEQDGKSWSFQHNFNTLFSVVRSGGVYFGFGACSDTWGDSDVTVATPWVKHEISGFRGWYRDPLEGSWEPVSDADSFSTFNSTNWKMGKYSKATGTVVKKDGNDCVNADGTVTLIDPTTSNLTIMCSLKSIPDKTRPLRYRFDLYNEDTSFSSPSREFGVSFLLAGSGKNTSTWPDSLSWNGDYRWCVSGWMYGFGFDWRLENGQGRWGYDHVFGTGDHAKGPNNKSATTAWQDWVSRSDGFKTYKQRNIRADFIYDPRGMYMGVFCTSSPNGQFGQCTRSDFVLPDAWKTTQAGFPGSDWELWKTERKSSVVGIRAKASESDYIQLELRRFTLEQLADAQAGELGTVLNVAANASATVKAGELMDGQTVAVARFAAADLAKGATLTVKPATSATKAAVGKVVSGGAATFAAGSGAAVSVGDVTLTGDDTDTGVTLTGNVAFGDTLTLTVPSAWRHTRHGVVTAIDASGATAGLGSLTADKVVVRDEDGVIPAKKYDLEIRDGKLFVNLTHGMAILLR